MIITKIKLDPFGNLSGKELEFKPGLNVILGPNEAGKSTVFNAAQKVLLVQTKIGKKELEKEIKRFIPISGGDTVYVELHFVCEGNSYVLKKKWGGTKFAELRLPDGAIITDDAAITKKLESLLPAREGTLRTVLMTYQSGLERTLDDLNKDPNAVHDLGDILRKAVLETDGVSVDKFKAEIEKQFADYFGRWDRAGEGPEGGHGIANPWKKGVGSILAAFYEKEAIRVNFENARRLEEDIDTVNREIAICSKSVAESEIYIKSNKKTVEDVQERRILNAELMNSQTKVVEFKGIIADWPAQDKLIETINKDMPTLKERELSLQKEKADAEKESKNRAIREKYARVKEKKEQLDESERGLQKVKILTSENLEEIRKAFTKVESLRAGISAGRLAVHFDSKRTVSLLVQKDVEPAYQKEVKSGEPLQLSAGGRVRLEHTEWSLDLLSGEGDFEEIEKNYELAMQQLENILKKYAINTLEEAIKTNKAYEHSLGEVEKVRGIYKSELGDDTYEGIEERIKEAGDHREVRPLSVIIEELVNLQTATKLKNEELETCKKKVDEYIQKYTSFDQLLSNLSEAMSKGKTIQEKIQKLVPLPEDVQDLDLFIKKYEKIKENLENENKDRNVFELRKTDLMARMPEESSEEIGQRLKDAEENFRTVVRRGEAIARIKDLTERTLEAMDTGSFKPLEIDVERYVAAMTNDRYSEVEMDRGLPQGFVRHDGETLSYNLLSHGTRDMLCLALRLAMARHFLHGKEGFMVLDDPLVNLDPNRQKEAAELIALQAQDKQIIIFTCHPSHADLLKGNTIEL